MAHIKNVQRGGSRRAMIWEEQVFSAFRASFQNLWCYLENYRIISGRTKKGK